MPRYQVTFLPWYEIKKNFSIGSVTLWPYYGNSNHFIKDKILGNWLDRYFQRYVDNNDKPVKSITICSINNDFFSLSNDLDILRKTIDCLIFAAIAPQVVAGAAENNNTLAPPSSDLFELVTQRFETESDFISVAAGNRLCGGLQIENVRFSKPWSIGGPFSKVDLKLVSGVQKLFKPCIPKNFRERVFRSLEWFRLAHSESDQVSILTRVVMMATAFEVLLGFETNQKTKEFASQVENIIASDRFVLESRRFKEPVERSLAYWWAWDFYSLRNDIVHGNKIKPDDLLYKDWITHLIVADIVFYFFVLFHLVFNGLIGREASSLVEYLSQVYGEPVEHELKYKMVSQLYNFTQAYRALGWIKV